MFNSNHDACVSMFLNDVNARTKKTQVVPISARKPIRIVNQSVTTTLKKQLLQTSLSRNPRAILGCFMRTQIVQVILFIVDFGCTKHMTGNLKLLCNFVEKYPGMIRKSTSSVRYLEGNDLLLGSRGSDLYTITLQDLSSTTPICFLAKAS
ncbi:hypothetical protein Tco_0725900 [Tanacetum coccineum]|uniref:Uncharacterized protein n=1 Tax=Tanacetum coccineum TaxID=301880 RepID=A0ABQ4YE59_9ASTR